MNALKKFFGAFIRLAYKLVKGNLLFTLYKLILQYNMRTLINMKLKANLVTKKLAILLPFLLNLPLNFSLLRIPICQKRNNDKIY